MANNKAEWAYRLLQSKSETVFKVPAYIVDAVDWVDDKANNE